MAMTNAEWMLKQGYKFRELTCKGSSKTGNCDYDILLNNKCVGKVKNIYSDEAITTWLDMEHEETEDKHNDVKHAHWIVIDSDSDGDEAFCHCWGTLKCSHCGYERETEDGYMPVYCECCGSKMDGEIEG